MEQNRDALIIRIAKTETNLGMSAFYSSGSVDSVPYSEIPHSEKDISATSEIIDGLLSKAYDSVGPQDAPLQQLADSGRKLFEIVLSQPIKDCIRKSRDTYLIFSIDEELMGLPWELMHDGREFLCLRFAMSRSVGRHEFKGAYYQPVRKQLKAMVLAPSSTSIGMSYNEGVAVINAFYTKREKVKASLQIMDIGLKFLNDNFRGNDIAHFVGQVDYNQFDSSKSGWSFFDGVFSSDRIRSIGRLGGLPYFVFSDAYQAGRPGTWPVKNSSRGETCDTAKAFLSSGTGHFIRTFWKMPDEARVAFVSEFYGQALAGETVGEAVRLARSKVISSFGKSSLAWATYSLYGDPAMTIFERKIEASSPAPIAAPVGGVLTLPSFSKIKMPLIILAILTATFFADRVFNRAYVAREETGVGKEIGSGLKYLVSMKESDKDITDAIGKGDSAFRGSGAFNVLWWKDIAIDAIQRFSDQWTAKLSGRFGKSASPLTAEIELARLYNDIFCTENSLYLGMLAKVNLKASLNIDALAATVRPIKDTRARKLFIKAKISRADGKIKDAIKYAQAALVVARAKDDRRDEATVLGFIGALYIESGKQKEAIVCIFESKKLLEKLRDTIGTADAYFNLGLLVGRMHEIARRADIRYLEKALRIYKSAKRYDDAGRTCLFLGYSYAARNEFDTAIGYIDSAVKIAKSNDDIVGQALAYKAYGDIHIEKKEYVNAENFYKHVLTILKLPENDEDALACLDSLYRMDLLNLSWRDRVGAANYFGQIVKFMDNVKFRGITDRYKNTFKILGMLNSFSGEDIPKDTMRSLYMQMAVSSFAAGDHKSADRFIDLALSYKAKGV